MKKNKNNIIFPALALITFTILLLVAGACQKDQDIEISMGEPVKLSATTDNVELSQELYSSTAVTYTWTRGSNRGTGSSISYIFEMDLAEHNFSDPEVFEVGKGAYEVSFTVSELNELLTKKWNVEPEKEVSLEARVIADISDESVADDTSAVVMLSTQAFVPVPESLYMVGTAVPNGSDITNAFEMNQDPVQPWIFSYQGPLQTGTFLFSVTRDDCWCNGFYVKDEADSTVMSYVDDGAIEAGWTIMSSTNYKVTANLVTQTVSIEKFSGPEYQNLYIVGDASPSGWDIAAPQPFTQDEENPYIFTFEGNFTPGEFKISTFTGDWCEGEWINATAPDQVLTATDFIITQGCDGPDNKWRVTADTAGSYRITVDLFNNTIQIEAI